jgi:hypothetical protein
LVGDEPENEFKIYSCRGSMIGRKSRECPLTLANERIPTATWISTNSSRFSDNVDNNDRQTDDDTHPQGTRHTKFYVHLACPRRGIGTI